MTAKISNQVGCSQIRVVQLLGQDRRDAIYRIERSELDYGVHWFWAHQNTAYTAAGLRVMADAFDGLLDHAAAIALRDQALVLEKETTPELDRKSRQYKDNDLGDV